jgi:competence protein ComEC
MLKGASLLLFSLGGFLGGTAIVTYYGLSVDYPLTYLALTIFCLVVVPKKSSFWLILAVSLGFVSSFVAVSHFNAAQKMPAEGPAIIRGFITSEPEIKGKSQKFMVLTESGARIEVITSQFPSHALGQQVLVGGRVMKTSDKQDLLKRRGGRIYFPQKIHLVEGVRPPANLKFRSSLVNIKNILQEQVRRYLQEPGSELINGIIFGTRQGLSKTLNELLIASGTIHIIALSGFNITIIIDFFRRVTLHFHRTISLFFSTFGIIAFVLATALSASVVRAAIMGWIWLYSRHCGRQGEPIVAILLSAAIMVAINPYILLYDVGFQLSFAALLGLIYLSPIIIRKIAFFGRPLADILGPTLAATIMTVPLLAFYFERFSVISPLSNIFILPFIPMLMLAGFILSLLGLMAPPLAASFAVVPWLLTEYMLRVIKFFGEMAYAQYPFQGGTPAVFAGYYLVVGLFIWLEGRLWKKRNFLLPL